MPKIESSIHMFSVGIDIEEEFKKHPDKYHEGDTLAIDAHNQRDANNYTVVSKNGKRELKHALDSSPLFSSKSSASSTKSNRSSVKSSSPKSKKQRVEHKIERKHWEIKDEQTPEDEIKSNDCVRSGDIIVSPSEKYAVVSKNSWGGELIPKLLKTGDRETDVDVKQKNWPMSSENTDKELKKECIRVGDILLHNTGNQGTEVRYKVVEKNGKKHAKLVESDRAYAWGGRKTRKLRKTRKSGKK